MTSAQQAAIAAQQLLQRRRARESFADWARVCGFEPAVHHMLLINKLEAVVRGDIRRLAIFMPPGSAKSTYSSDLFPPWFLARRPGSNILTASHSSDLATMFGRRARNRVIDHETILGYSLRKDSQAADEWSTNHGGTFFCAGVGGKIAGRRADLGLIDDPVGSKEDAYSKLIRDKTWDWYKYDFQTRLKPGASVVLVQTRWHEDDLAGRLLQTEADEWEVINLPMLAKDNDPLGRAPGEMLWANYFTPDMLRNAQKDPSMWSALYQQDPTPEDGDYFRRDWIDGQAYNESELPSLSELKIYIASDHAVSEKETADSSCFMPIGVDREGVIWVLPDVFWDRVNTLDAVEIMLRMMKRYRPQVWWAEADKIEKAIGPFLRKRMRETGIFTYVESIRPAKDKQSRARSIQGRMQAKMVRLPRFAPWYNNALLQMLKFPAGSHDDFIDPLAYIGLGLDKMSGGERTPEPIDEAIYYQPRPLTMGWLKNSHNKRERSRRLALMDN